MIYEIAGLKVEMRPLYGRLLHQSQAYLSSGKPVFHIFVDSEDERVVSLHESSKEEQEYICCSAMFCRQIIQHGRFFLHASAIVYQDEAYLFSAPSGTGKSTHTALWKILYEGSYILNDDKPVIEPHFDQITVWGTPFAGKTNLQVNQGVTLKSICFIRQGDVNHIEKISKIRAISLMLENTWRPHQQIEMNCLLDMIEQVVSHIDIYEMSCTKDVEAAKLSYRIMKGK